MATDVVTEVMMQTRLRLVVPLVLASLVILTSSVRAQPSGSLASGSDATIGTATEVVRTGSLNINRLWLKVRNDGIIGYDSVKGTGLTFPYQYGRMLYADNLVWMGKVYDGQTPSTAIQMPELRTGGGIWRTGVRPGSIIRKGVAEDPSSDAVRVFRFRPDFRTADLTYDAAASYGVDPSAVTAAMVGAVRSAYEKDLSEWPWQKGAPFYDRNNNGMMDHEELPGLQNASQVVWFTYNDLDEERSKLLAGSPPIGLEIQVTLWAYNGVPNLDDIIFKRYRVLYKGTASSSANATIDSMYFSQWVDPEIGSLNDDLGGCDSALSLGYQFNATENDPVFKNLGGANPALGYALLQGPLVNGGPIDEGIQGSERRRGMKNLTMTSFMLNPTGDPISEPGYNTRTFWYWNVARGFVAYARDLTYTPYVLPNGHTTKYMYSGDPIAKTGWIDGLGQMYAGAASVSPGSRRFTMSTGPFAMALGDTQEVVLAIIASSASPGVENVTWLKNRAKLLHAIYPSVGDYAASFVTGVKEANSLPRELVLYQNFPNPFNPSTQIKFSLPAAAPARLAIFDMLGREVRVLHDGSLDAGVHQVTWDGRSSIGIPVPSGVYFCRLVQGGRQLSQKLLLVR